MPEPDFQMLQTLPYVTLGLLAWLLVLGLRISGSLKRIERKLGDMANGTGQEASPPSPAETQTGGAFETFLSEDPARRLLAKSEQFAAYRKWRQENGLNWSGS
jgi:hypothetical protein